MLAVKLPAYATSSYILLIVLHDNAIASSYEGHLEARLHKARGSCCWNINSA